MNPFGTLVTKELQVELRSRQALLGSLILALLILLVFWFGFSKVDQAAEPETDVLAPGMIWAAVVFAGLGLLGNSFNKEVDRRTLDGLLMAPVSRGQLFGGKLMGNLILLYLVEAFIVVAYMAIFGSNPFSGQEGRLVLVMGLGGLGITAVGTLMAAIAARVPGAWVLLPLLVVPLLIKTVLEMSVAATTYLVEGHTDLVDNAVVYLVLFDIVYIVAGVGLAEYTL